MENQNWILVVIAILIGLAVYLAMTSEKVEPMPQPANNTTVNDTGAVSLLMKGIDFGKGYANYVYSFERVSDGYKTAYTLSKGGNSSMIEVTNPLSVKKAYFLANDTILCIDYAGESVCSSVKDKDNVENYMDSLEAEFFSDSRIDRNSQDMSYLIAYDYADIDPQTRDRDVGGFACSDVAYKLDYSDVSLSEAARFGISSNSPRLFSMSMCVDNRTGYRIHQEMNYSYDGMLHTFSSTLLSFQPNAATDITAPQNTSEGAVDLLFKERTQQTKLAKCFIENEGGEREKCIADLALTLKKPDLCGYAGARRDRCLVSIVPSTRNESICSLVSEPSYLDDCYTELAGAFKNSTYCSNVQNASKASYCLGISVPKNQTSNNSTINVLDIMNRMENYENSTG